VFMTAKPKDEVQSMANRLWGEIQSDAAQNARQLFDGVPDDARELSQREYQAYVRRNWADPGFRQGLRQRLGAEEFLKVARLVAPEVEDQASAALSGPALRENPASAQPAEAGIAHADESPAAGEA
jgi:hypothetical protein